MRRSPIQRPRGGDGDALSRLPLRTGGSNSAKTTAIHQESGTSNGGVLANVGMLHDRGVVIALETDTGNPYVFPGYSVHRELVLLVRAGLTPVEALEAATLARLQPFFGTYTVTANYAGQEWGQIWVGSLSFRRRGATWIRGPGKAGVIIWIHPLCSGPCVLRGISISTSK